jgi:hypothetical protein
MNNTYPDGRQPNIFWRLTSALIAIDNAKNYLIQHTETKDKKTWHKYVMSHVGIAFEFAIIVEEQLSKNYLIADRLIEFYHILYKYWDDNTDVVNIKQTVRIYKTLYKATFKFWLIEIKRLNQTPEYLKQNAVKILNKEKDNIYGPENLVPYFIKLLELLEANET